MVGNVAFATILALLTALACANYRNPDKEYSIVKIGAKEFFDDVDCSDVKGRTFERGLYYDGTACDKVTLERELSNLSIYFFSEGQGERQVLRLFSLAR